jgi:hypothetical protein
MSDPSDRDLLEKAAKAAGYARMKYYDDTPYVSRDMSGDHFLAWNPLADDGDALRLAVKLGIAVQLHPAWVCARAVMPGDNLNWMEITEGWAHTKDHFAATRRAIVRAAAAIGKYAHE